MSDTKVNVMLDLETTGNKPGCGILSIGATVFAADPTVTYRVTVFYTAIKVSSNRDLLLYSDPETVKWWEAQHKDAYDAAWNSPYALCITEALTQFTNFLSNLGSEVVLWGNGADFDYPIIREACDRAEIFIPVQFRNVRCYRTLKNLFPYIKRFDDPATVPHHALWDAKNQAAHAGAILNWIDRCAKIDLVK